MATSTGRSDPVAKIVPRAPRALNNLLCKVIILSNVNKCAHFVVLESRARDLINHLITGSAAARGKARLVMGKRHGWEI